MITKIHVDNFKLYKENVSIPLSKINLLTGINGKGKSSLLQVLLLLNQSVLSNRATSKIILNGPNVKLGNSDDVKNKERLFSEPIKLGFTYDQFNIAYNLSSVQPDASELQIDKIMVKGELNNQEYQFNLERSDDLFKIVRKKPIGENTEFNTSLFDLFINETSLVEHYENFDCEHVKQNLNFTSIHYVSADRSGPKNYYENKSLGHFVSVGALGENTVNILYHKGNEAVHPEILKGYCDLFEENEEDISRTIEDHTNFWIGKIFQGAKVTVTPLKGEDLLKLRINSDGGATYFKPTNVGYGFSYSLPIIVAGLTAKPGEILIVENPEAHLHPHAQSVLSKFLSLVSRTGVQVFIESHSDHILNGLRICVNDKILDKNDLNILYFDLKDNQYCELINVDNEGGIDNWPPQFFDQSTNDLNYLLGI